MHITNSMIHPELRTAGRIYRGLLPHFSKRIFRLASLKMKLMKGRCRSKDLHYEERMIPRPDKSQLRICVYSPVNQRSAVPGLLWLHGGGYALGTPEMDEPQIRRFIEATHCVVVAPDYRLSLKVPYPAALEDAYTALVWLNDHGGEYGMREDQLMVGGFSAGGGLAAAICLYARDRGEVAIAFQMPLYPMIDDRMATLSAARNDAPIWNSRSSQVAWELYLGDLFGLEVPAYAAPARALDLAGMPPACSFVGSIDPFRDETVAYVEKLLSSGVQVNFREFKGCFHAFDLLCPKAKVAGQARDFLMMNFSYAAAHYYAKQPPDRRPQDASPSQGKARRID